MVETGTGPEKTGGTLKLRSRERRRRRAPPALAGVGSVAGSSDRQRSVRSCEKGRDGAIRGQYFVSVTHAGHHRQQGQDSERDRGVLNTDRVYCDLDSVVMKAIAEKSKRG